MSGPISQFIRQHYRHFNAATLVDAAEGYVKLLDEGGRMFVTMAGAMSTAELGLSLAEMIRRDKVHGICCTGANLEEDLYNLVAHNQYERVPNYRDLSPRDEQALLDRQLNRVTDTCIPEEEAMRRLEQKILPRWKAAEAAGERKFPHEFLYDSLLSGELEEHYEIEPKHSWMLAAAQKNLPLFVPGWEDSTLGNLYAAQLFSSMKEDMPDIEDRIASGEWSPLLAWLRNRIHEKGKLFMPAKLIEIATGKPPSVEPFLDYLREKYGKIYSLK